MNVLDPFEVAEIEVYAYFELERAAKAKVKSVLGSAEYTVFQKVLKASKLRAVLNEANIPKRTLIKLPKPHRGRIIPAELFEIRKHPDVRIARRASTIASLAKVISEREVSGGLRRTLLTQARRLELLAKKRFQEFETEMPSEELGEETGESAK